MEEQATDSRAFVYTGKLTGIIIVKYTTPK